jgi:hypothetical protein
MPNPRPEVTSLSPAEEGLFRQWLGTNGVKDNDDPASHYDYRGFYKATQGAPHPPGAVAHFPDTFKQHGHPTFSVESQYSQGPFDGGMWAGDQYLPQMTPAVSHDQSASVLQQAIRGLTHFPR